jgi:hypothetical protein
LVGKENTAKVIIYVKFYNMENIIKETTQKLKSGIITKDEADKILLDLFGVCKHEGEKGYSEGFGFFCLDCGRHFSYKPNMTSSKKI